MRAGVSETQDVRARFCKSPRNRQIYAGTPDAYTSLDLAVLLTGAVATGEVVMRYLFGFLCVCALGVMPVVGCSDTGGGGSAGSANDAGGGAGGSGIVVIRYKFQ